MNFSFWTVFNVCNRKATWPNWFLMLTLLLILIIIIIITIIIIKKTIINITFIIKITILILLMFVTGSLGQTTASCCCTQQRTFPEAQKCFSLWAKFVIILAFILKWLGIYICLNFYILSWLSLSIQFQELLMGFRQCLSFARVEGIFANAEGIFD